MRDKHLFQFGADAIAQAAKAEAAYHRDREAYWRDELEKSIATVKETARVDVREVPVTGGKRVNVYIDYGDPGAYQRLTEASEKIDQHRQAAERYETDARIYGTQGVTAYQLETDDVHYYRLGGEPRHD